MTRLRPNMRPGERITAKWANELNAFTADSYSYTDNLIYVEAEEDFEKVVPESEEEGTERVYLGNVYVLGDAKVKDPEDNETPFYQKTTDARFKQVVGCYSFDYIPREGDRFLAHAPTDGGFLEAIPRDTWLRLGVLQADDMKPDEDGNVVKWTVVDEYARDNIASPSLYTAPGKFLAGMSVLFARVNSVWFPISEGVTISEFTLLEDLTNNSALAELDGLSLGSAYQFEDYITDLRFNRLKEGHKGLCKKYGSRWVIEQIDDEFVYKTYDSSTNTIKVCDNTVEYDLHNPLDFNLLNGSPIYCRYDERWGRYDIISVGC